MEMRSCFYFNVFDDSNTNCTQSFIIYIYNIVTTFNLNFVYNNELLSIQYFVPHSAFYLSPLSSTLSMQPFTPDSNVGGNALQ